MASRPFWAVIEFNLTALGQQTNEYQVGAGNEFEIKRIQYASTGAFNIIDINNQGGDRYTNASLSEPLPANIFPDVDVDNNNPADLQDPIIIKNNGSIQFTLVDTSNAGNVVSIVLSGFLKN